MIGGSGGGLGPGFQGREWAGKLIADGLGVAVFFLVLGLGAFSVFSSLLVAVFPLPPGQRFLQDVERNEAVRALGHLRLPPDPTLSPQDAGALLLAIDTLSVEDWWESIPVPVGLAGSRIVSGGGPFGSCPTPAECHPHAISVDSVLPAAFSGLNEAERAYLQDWARDPRESLYSKLARAPGIDDGVYNSYHPDYPPLPPNPSVSSIPFGDYDEIEDVWVSRLATAALLVSDGRLDEAEEVLLDVVSVGFLLLEESTVGVGAIPGRLVAGRGISALQAFYVLSGRTNEALQLAVSETTQNPNAEEDGEAPPLEWEEFLFDSDMVPSVRFHALRMALLNHTCGSFRGIVFGPSPAFMDSIQGRLRNELVRYPYQEMTFEAIIDWVARSDGLDAGASGSLLTDQRRALGRGLARLLAFDRIMACVMF